MKEISPFEISDNVFKLIGTDWGLVSAKKSDGSYNTMTVSWGGMGVLWERNVCFIFVRRTRYTHEFIENSDTMTLSFYPESFRPALRICGSKSGRNCDKAALAGLTPVDIDGDVYFKGARLVLKLRKLYKSSLDEAHFIDRQIPDKVYPLRDFHDMYICEIEKIIAE